jgi:hypothetical protein
MTPKRPRDSNQLAKSIIDIATGKKPDRDPTPEEQGKDPAAVAMGKKGDAAKAAVTLNDQAVAVVLDFMDPVRPSWVPPLRATARSRWLCLRHWLGGRRRERRDTFCEVSGILFKTQDATHHPILIQRGVARSIPGIRDASSP